MTEPLRLTYGPIKREPADAIVGIVRGQSGIRGSLLMAHLATEFLSWEKDSLRHVVTELVRIGELVEIEFILPGQVKSDSFFLPAGSKVMGVINGD